MQPPPGLSVLAPRLAFSQAESWPGQHEGSGHIVPQGVANEVERVQRVPRQLVAHLRKGLPRVRTMQRPVAGTGLDADRSLLEVATMARARESLEYHPWGIRTETHLGSPSGRPRDRPSLKAHVEHPPTTAEPHPDLLGRTPPLQAAVSVERLLEQASHCCSVHACWAAAAILRPGSFAKALIGWQGLAITDSDQIGWLLRRRTRA